MKSNIGLGCLAWLIKRQHFATETSAPFHMRLNGSFFFYLCRPLVASEAKKKKINCQVKWRFQLWSWSVSAKDIGHCSPINLWLDLFLSLSLSLSCIFLFGVYQCRFRIAVSMWHLTGCLDHICTTVCTYKLSLFTIKWNQLHLSHWPWRLIFFCFVFLLALLCAKLSPGQMPTGEQVINFTIC